MTSVPNYTEPKQGYVYSLFLEQKYRKRHCERQTQKDEWKQDREKVRGEREKIRNEINMERKQGKDRE